MNKLHRFVGLAAAVPLLLWALTGLVFLTKPGYEGAYERLSPRTYPLTADIALSPRDDWREARLLRTVLGDHLLVLDQGRWRHLDTATLQDRPPPTDAELKALVEDAVANHAARYGNVIMVEDGVATTDTGVEITLEWSRLAFSQQGHDTRLIDTLYRIHYLQWLGEPALDKLLGIAGLTLLLALLVTGITMQLFRKR